MTTQTFHRILIILLSMCIVGFFGPVFIMLLAPNHLTIPMIYGQVFSVVVIAAVLLGIWLETDR